LTRAWINTETDSIVGEVYSAFAWSWNVPKVKKDGTEYMGKLSAAKWTPFYLWEKHEEGEDIYPGGQKEWIRALAKEVIQPECGPVLPTLFYSPDSHQVLVEELEDWKEQAVAKELRVAKGSYEAAQALGGGDGAGFFKVLQEVFPQSREACVYMSHLCEFIPVCHGGDSTRGKPLESGLFKLREPHHDEGVGEE
jgi:hypothetical protein